MKLKSGLYLSMITLIATLSVGCSSGNSSTNENTETLLDTLKTSVVTNQTIKDKTDNSPKRVPADAITILSRKQVPVLCYHQIREWKSTDSKTAKDVITSPATFRNQIKMLADSGYTSILPDQLYDYLLYGDELPKKPVMITFDDNDGTQYSDANPILKEFGFKGVYFIMTVTIGRPRYMSKAQLKELSDEGNIIASHTWDHHNVRQYKGEDWVTQIEKPSKVLEEITGKKVEYFAFPFGAWNEEALPELKKRGMKASFILSTKRDPHNPMQTIRRIIASGYWNGKSLYNAMTKTFEDGKG
jgi:peptidoglycan/xylan/chitin deacetylase (PgdA/CDA1 family)